MRMFGASRPEDILGGDVLSFVHSDDRQQVAERISQMQSSRKTVQFCDSKLIRLDGENDSYFLFQGRDQF